MPVRGTSSGFEIEDYCKKVSGYDLSWYRLQTLILRSLKRYAVYTEHEARFGHEELKRTLGLPIVHQEPLPGPFSSFYLIMPLGKTFLPSSALSHPQSAKMPKFLTNLLLERLYLKATYDQLGSNQAVKGEYMNRIFRLLGVSLLGLVLAACSLQPATPTTPAEPEIETQANFYKQFGGQVNNTSVSTNYPPSMALDSSGNPVVSWSEHSGFSTELYVKRWTGSSWIQLGTFLNTNTAESAFYPSLAVDNSDNPVVSWQETDGTSY